MNNLGQILCFGEVLWDNLPSGAVPGGAPMNVALHLKRFGINSFIASSVGNDEKGHNLVVFMENSGMDTHLVQRHETLATSEVKVWLNDQNNASFEICEPVAWDDIQLTPELLNAARNSAAIVFGSLASRNAATRNTLSALLELDLIKILDVNLRAPFNRREVVEPLLKRADIVKLNDEELVIIASWFSLSGSTAQLATQLYKILSLATLMVTRGDKGALLIHNNETFEHNGYKVKVADTVGSGDAFLAGFLAAYADGKNMDTAITEACAIGAFVATQHGATPEYNRSILSIFTASVNS
ncbi:MAG: carbohydrate kinase [Lentimicrobium sp.]